MIGPVPSCITIMALFWGDCNWFKNKVKYLALRPIDKMDIIHVQIRFIEGYSSMSENFIRRCLSWKRYTDPSLMESDI